MATVLPLRSLYLMMGSAWLQHGLEEENPKSAHESAGESTGVHTAHGHSVHSRSENKLHVCAEGLAASVDCCTVSWRCPMVLALKRVPRDLTAFSSTKQALIRVLKVCLNLSLNSKMEGEKPFYFLPFSRIEFQKLTRILFKTSSKNHLRSETCIFSIK